MTSDKVSPMTSSRTGGSTHVVKYDGGTMTMEISDRRDISVFANTLQRFNGVKPWALTLTHLPDDVTYDEFVAAKLEATEFLQAGGSADCMTIEVRQPGGRQWGVASVWSVVGHRTDSKQPLDVPIALPRSTQMISCAEVFAADEAAELFFSYYQTGTIPEPYVLRPLSGWTSDGQHVDLRGTSV